MARVFTTSFEFNHHRYDAIVTIIAREGLLDFNVKLLDIDLHDFFPDGVIKYQGSDGFQQLDIAKDLISQSVIKKLGEAINQHLLTTQ